jgi:hypothetical protein
MVDHRNFKERSRSNKPGLAQLSGIKISKKDKIAWWAVLAAGIILATGFALRD